MTDARSTARFALHIEVGMESDHNFYTGLTQDISRGGVFVATHRLWPVGDCLRLHLTLPGVSAAIDTLGEVRWIRDERIVHSDEGLPTGMGLRFMDLAGPAREAINVFLERREALFYDDE